jgi:HD-GYP domain-containing protein (c-di-GMP phosphodiesterase class II)
MKDLLAFNFRSSFMQSALAGEDQFDERLLEHSSRMDEFEGYDRPHGARIADISDKLAAHFNLASHDRYFLRLAAYLHDIGEVVMNREYIGAGTILTDDELLDMRRHPVIGEQEVARLGLPRGVQLLVRWHHEWWNGSGYPDALEGEQIPLAARILRVSDTYAALIASRPFRGAISPEDAGKYLTEWAGIEFDPKVVRRLVSIEHGASSEHSVKIV